MKLKLARTLILALGVWGGALDARDSSLPATSGAFYAISVGDIDAAIEWYTAHLGFKLASRGGNEQRKGALLTRPGTVLELGEFTSSTTRDALRPGLESHEIQGIFKLGFLTDEIDATFAYLEGAGVEVFFPVVTTSDGKRTFAVRDPEGNIVQFFGE